MAQRPVKLDYTGQRIGRLLIVNRSPDPSRQVIWNYRCDCGAEGRVRSESLKGGQKSCGCESREALANKEVCVGKRQGKLVVVRIGPSIAKPNGGNVRTWECACDCGKTAFVRTGNIAKGQKSCGCERGKYPVEIRQTHGDAPRGRQTKEYVTWSSMKLRCYREAEPSFADYGGRGIYVCDRWRKSYEEFLADMGRKPSRNHSIDRINNDGSYTCGRHDICADCRERNAPANCRWATAQEQCNNQRSNVRITVNGETRTVAEWARHSNITKECIYERLKRKMGPALAVTKPMAVPVGGKKRLRKIGQTTGRDTARPTRH